MLKIALIAVTIAVMASPANADPISAIATWVATTFSVGAATALAITNVAIGIGASIIGKFLAPKPEQPSVSVSFDVQMGDDKPLFFTVGDYVTPGNRKFMSSWGENTRYITEVVEVSSIPTRGLEKIWVNDEEGEVLWEQVDTDGQGFVLGNPIINLDDPEDAPEHRMWVKFVDGNQTEADPLLVRLFNKGSSHRSEAVSVSDRIKLRFEKSDKHNSDGAYIWDHRMIGIGKAYVIVTTRFDAETLNQYPKFLYKTEPLPLYDLRFDSTNGGDGPQRWNDKATWEPSRNPAVIAYNIARGVYYGEEWVYGGKNLSAWRLPSPEWIAAANACDEPITLKDGTVEPRYRAGAEIKVDVEPLSVMEEIGKAANMRFAEVGGRFKAVVDLPGAAIFNITDDDIIITSGQSLQPFYPLTDTFNAISSTYPEPGEKWTNKDAQQYIDEEMTADDGGRYLPTSVSYPAAPYGNQVQRLMISQLKDFRRMRRHQFSLPPGAYGLEPLVDMISWTSKRNNYSNKLFVVEQIGKLPGMNVTAGLREADPNDYDRYSEFEKPVLITEPINVRPFIQPIRGFIVTGVAVEDAQSRARKPAILVSCMGGEAGVTHIQIEYRIQNGDQKFDSLNVFREPFSWYIHNVLPLTTYEVRARLVSELTPKSEWSAWITVTTPDIRLGSLDVEFSEIQEEIRTDLDPLENWASNSSEWLRELIDEMAAIRDKVAEVDFRNFAEHQEITREAMVSLGNAKAEFVEQIDVAVSETEAVARRVTSLGVRVGENTASIREESVARADADTALSSQVTTIEAKTNSNTSAIEQERTARAATDEALAAEIDSVEVSLGTKATSSSVTALQSRVTTVEGAATANSNALTLVNSRVDDASANGLFRVETTAAPSGSQSRISLAAEAAKGATSHDAALHIEAKSDGTNQVIVEADRFAIASSTGTGAERAVPFFVDNGRVFMDGAYVRGTIQSPNYINGEEGWAIRNDGSAEFNDVTVRRQLEIASGEIPVPARQLVSFSDTEEAVPMRIRLTAWEMDTPITNLEWGSLNRTYLATADFTGEPAIVQRLEGDVYFGYEASVVPMTLYNGDRSLRIRFDLWTQNVLSITSHTISWKLYEVS